MRLTKKTQGAALCAFESLHKRLSTEKWYIDSDYMQNEALIQLAYNELNTCYNRDPEALEVHRQRNRETYAKKQLAIGKKVRTREQVRLERLEKQSVKVVEKVAEIQQTPLEIAERKLQQVIDEIKITSPFNPRFNELRAEWDSLEIKIANLSKK